MKKISILLLIAFITTNALAQMGKPVKKEAKTTAPVKMKISQDVPPPPPTTPAPAAPSGPYYLGAASVSITTGNDNKEQPSRPTIGLATAGGKCWPSDDLNTGCTMYDYNMSTRILEEYKVNSTVELQLRTPFQFPWTFPGGYGEGWRYINLLLSNIQNYGLKLFITYDPNFVLDAWKIEKVVLTLEFKDLNGTPHPTLGKVVIPFLNARALLNDQNRTLICRVDKFLMAIN